MIVWWLCCLLQICRYVPVWELSWWPSWLSHTVEPSRTKPSLTSAYYAMSICVSLCLYAVAVWFLFFPSPSLGYCICLYAWANVCASTNICAHTVCMQICICSEHVRFSMFQQSYFRSELSNQSPRQGMAEREIELLVIFTALNRLQLKQEEEMVGMNVRWR